MLCVLHCLAIPLALIAGSSVTALSFADERFHQLLIFLVVPVSFGALVLGCRKHKAWRVPVWGGCGLLVLVVTAFFGHDLVGEIGEKVFTVVGALILMMGHVLNFRLCRINSCA